jgi:hypothetical protein
MAKKRKGMSAAFLRNLRRKHGLGEFSKAKKSTKKIYKQVVNVAKKKGVFSRGGGNATMNDALKGVGASTIANKFVPSGQYKNLLSLGAAWYFGGMVGAFASVVAGSASLSGILPTGTASDSAANGGTNLG